MNFGELSLVAVLAVLRERERERERERALLGTTVHHGGSDFGLWSD
jgi:hypothetical protein